jgi:hypothetical protein
MTTLNGRWLLSIPVDRFFIPGNPFIEDRRFISLDPKTGLSLAPLFPLIYTLPIKL